MTWITKTEKTPPVLSPLSPLSFFLRNSRWVGFPLTATDYNRMTTFTFSYIFYVKFIGIVGFIVMGIIVLSSIGTHYGVSPIEMTERIVSVGGLSQTEMIAMIVGFSPSLMSTVGYGLIIKRMREPLNEFCEKMAELWSVLPVCKGTVFIYYILYCLSLL